MSDEAAVQAHVTVAYGDSVHTCAAAVNAVNLGRIDPRRRRIAFGWALSADARAILSHGWEVREVREPLGGTPARKTVILDARVHANKRAMLSRAMYWDTDHFPLLSGVRHIEQLWAVNPEASMVASREGAVPGAAVSACVICAVHADLASVSLAGLDGPLRSRKATTPVGLGERR